MVLWTTLISYQQEQYQVALWVPALHRITIQVRAKKAEKKIEAYERYYTCVETLLDSLDGTHNLDLMDTDLATDYGADYLDAKSKVDNLIDK